LNTTAQNDEKNFIRRGLQSNLLSENIVGKLTLCAQFMWSILFQMIPLVVMRYL